LLAAAPAGAQSQETPNREAIGAPSLSGARRAEGSGDFSSAESAAPITPVPRQAAAVAWVGGEPVRGEDLDASAREAASALEADLARARSEALEEAIQDRLLELDARRLGLSADRLYWREVVRPIGAPTEEQIRAEHAASKDLRGEPLESVRDVIIGALVDRRESQLFEERTARSQRRNRVVHFADPSAAEPSSSAVLATVAGKSITREAIEDRLLAREDELRWRAFSKQRAALEKIVRARLLDAEAARRGTTREALLEAEVEGKIRHPTEAEVADYFAKNRREFRGDPESSRAEIAGFLESNARGETETAFYDRLRAAAGVRVALEEPPTVRLPIATEGHPARGPESAPVTVVEFGDFECPPCGRTWPLVEDMLRGYSGDVRFVFREYPLSMHPHAKRAARAALAAYAQGRFWPYADRLFHNQQQLEEQALRGYAAEAGLNVARFERALAGEAAAAALVRDVREGRRYRVRGTPTYFVDGVRVRAYGEAGLRQAIERALAERPQGQKERDWRR